MHFLEINEVWAWCAEHGIALERDDSRPAPDPTLGRVRRELYGVDGPSGREPTVAADAVSALGEWKECLVWVVLWGVWSSTEDWPAYYGVRGARGERRALDVAPGQLYVAAEAATLVADLAQMMTFGWEAHVLPVRGDGPPGVRLFVSHDGWLELLAPATPGTGRLT